jgi:hypothetical protein
MYALLISAFENLNFVHIAYVYFERILKQKAIISVSKVNPYQKG